MQTFDTIKLQVPIDSIKAVNWQAFTDTEQRNNATGAIERFSKANRNALPVGVVSIGYKEGADFQLTLSAKTLKDNYLQGINLNTYEQAIGAVQPVIDIDPYRLLDAGGKVYLCDSTNNINRQQLNGATQVEVCKALLAGRGNDRFLPKWYESRKKLGVEFHGTQQEKNRIICYSKNLDLLKPQNKLFMKLLGNPSKMLLDAEKMIRFETNHTAFGAMRERFKVADNTLKQMLESKAPVNHNFLKKVLNVRGAGQMTLFDEMQQFKGSGEEFELYIGRQTIIKELGYNDVSVKQFYKQLYGERFKYHYYKKKGAIKEALAKLQAQQAADRPQAVVASLCNLCLDALLKAVA